MDIRFIDFKLVGININCEYGCCVGVLFTRPTEKLSKELCIIYNIYIRDRQLRHWTLSCRVIIKVATEGLQGSRDTRALGCLYSKMYYGVCILCLEECLHKGDMCTIKHNHIGLMYVCTNIRSERGLELICRYSFSITETLWEYKFKVKGLFVYIPPINGLAFPMPSS